MECWNSKEMPLSNNPQKKLIQEKIINGEKVSQFEVVELGMRDKVIKKIGNYECKPDYCYRAINLKALEYYKQKGFICVDNGIKEEYIEGQNNGGIDWYIGGACPSRYGEIIIECPADKTYFVPTHDNGIGMASEVDVRHMKSSPYNNPIPLSMITNIFDYSKVREQDKANFDDLRKENMQQRSILRQKQLNQINKVQEILNNTEELSSGGRTL